MFKIRGADKLDYGPVPAEVVRCWILERRANARTLVRQDGSAEWRPVGGFPEFAEALQAAWPGLGVGAGLSPGIPSPAASPGFRENRSPGNDRPRVPELKPVSRLAIVSFVASLTGVCTMGIGALAGLITGLAALRRIRRSAGALRGRSLARAGVWVSIPILIAWPAILLVNHNKVQRHIHAECRNNVRQLALAVRFHLNDNSDLLPAAKNWCDLIQPSVASGASSGAFQCPSRRALGSGYAFNARLGGLDESRVNPKTVLLFESDLGWNGSGGPEAAASRHGGSCVVAFVDGTVTEVKLTRISSLRWGP